jgi:large conductance mechanosensitive channel
MLKGFRDFVMRGNVIDLAVAVVIGAAFKTVVDAFVLGIVTPLIVRLGGGDVKFTVGPLDVGVVLTALINFLLCAAVVYFVFVLPMNTAKQRLKKPGEADAPPPSPEIQLLTEIRDLLRQPR